MPTKILSVVGARPQFIKAATLSRVFSQHKDTFLEVLVHTGQHYDDNMSDLFFRELEIPNPSYHLGINEKTHGKMTGRMLEALEDVMLKEKPDWVLLYGDTNSTLAGALAASKLGIKIIHVEAGLRSFNRSMPEEINRVLTDHLSTLLFCPTKVSVENLKTEGIEKGVYKVGDVMFDAALYAKEKNKERKSILEELGVKKDAYTLVTVHRAENTSSKETLTSLMNYISKESPTQNIVLPLHPRTRKVAAEYNVDLSKFIICDPVSYFDMAQLLDGCVQVMTDSGGVQKEAYFHQKPCLTLRSETEWVETIEAGWNRLWTGAPYCSPRTAISDYGTGRAAEDIIDVLQKVAL